MREPPPVEGARGTDLHVRAWPVERPRGRLLLVHGLGEHTGRYEPLAEALTRRGYAVLAYDQRGHGRSAGRRGHVDAFELFIEDLVAVHSRMNELLPGPGLPFLYGHSMGGLVLLRYLQTRRPPAPGAVLSAPWLATLAEVAPWKRLAARALRVLAPWARVPTGMDATGLTRDPARQESYLTDPLVGRGISVGLWDAVAVAQAEALASGVPDLPLLLLLPGEDRVTDAAVSARWSRSAAVETLALPGFLHEPHNELGRAEVFERVADWLDRRSVVP